MDTKHSTNQRQLTVRISRGVEDGNFSTYSVPWRENQTVLDVVTEVQRMQEPSLSYRYACRVGVCGSCAMTVNGKPRWTCRTHVSRVEENGVIVIEPLRNMPRIKDLVVDMREFFQKWARAGNTFVGTATRNDPPAPVSPQSKKRKLADAAIECINCGVCYAACDVVSWDKDYLGPAPEPGMDALQRRTARRSQGRPAQVHLRQRLQLLSHAGQLHDALSGQPESHRQHRGIEAQRHFQPAQGRLTWRHVCSRSSA